MKTTKQICEELTDIVKRIEMGDISKEDKDKLLNSYKEIKEIEIIYKPLNKTEKDDLKRELRTIMQPRFNNYKNGTKKADGAILKVHYSQRIIKTINFLVQKMIDGSPYYACCGVCTPDNPNGICKHNEFLKPRGDTNIFNFVFDHFIEQNTINLEMKYCIEQLLKENPIKTYIKDNSVPPDEFVDHCKKNYKVYTEKKPQNEISKLLDHFLDLRRYENDLYGSNLYLRCRKCDTESKPYHPKYDKKGIYLKRRKKKQKEV